MDLIEQAEEIATRAAIEAVNRYTKRKMPEQEYFNTMEAAKYLGLSKQCLEGWRCYGDGPKYTKLAQAVRYKKSELDAFMLSNQKSHTAEGGDNA